MENYQSINFVGSEYRVFDLNFHHIRMNNILERKNQFFFDEKNKSIPKRSHKKNYSTDLGK